MNAINTLESFPLFHFTNAFEDLIISWAKWKFRVPSFTSMYLNSLDNEYLLATYETEPWEATTDAICHRESPSFQFVFNWYSN